MKASEQISNLKQILSISFIGNTWIFQLAVFLKIFSLSTIGCSMVRVTTLDGDILRMSDHIKKSS